ncbi:MAG TPA: hypothetical protein VGX78_05950, partial [Pirellulales bacterium]|nr:hypothetical protein [Pirellulales bacterium]
MKPSIYPAATHSCLLLALTIGGSWWLESAAKAGVLLATYGNTNKVEAFGPSGTDRGAFATTGLSGPTGLAFDARGNLYVS